MEEYDRGVLIVRHRQADDRHLNRHSRGTRPQTASCLQGTSIAGPRSSEHFEATELWSERLHGGLLCSDGYRVSDMSLDEPKKRGIQERQRLVVR